jgi:predicted dehydrogenase
MILTPEQRDLGRRNFLKALAGTPALGVLGAATLQGAVKGGPVRIGMIGVGGQGRALLGRVNPAQGTVVAMADINPSSLQRADQVLATRKQPAARHYTEYREMFQKEDIEAVIIAVPLWAHADVTVDALAAGTHVLCEKMMAYTVADCQRMIAASEKANRLLEIGYQRNYSPLYRSAYEGIIKRGLLGDVYTVRLAWHRNGNWRRAGAPPSPDFDASRWGYPSFEHLLNWRLYHRYSRGLFAELASHQVNAVNWYLDSAPRAVHASGGVYRYKDGREVPDHVFAIFEYPGGVTATFTSIESNAHDQRYEAFYGTKGTLILYNEAEAMFFEEGGGGAGEARGTSVEISGKAGGAAIDASETKAANNGVPAKSAGTAVGTGKRTEPGELQISGFCSAIRNGTPLLCGPQKAMNSAKACIAGVDAIARQARLTT